MQDKTINYDKSCGSSKSNEKNYYLLNKDVTVARFRVNMRNQVITIDEQYIELPEWFGELDTFIVNRRSPKKRENIEELLKLSGCDTITGFLDISHALSLIDTFWVKEVTSDLCWEDVSLYTHPFNEVIAKTAFEGAYMAGSLAPLLQNMAQTVRLRNAG